MKNNYQLIFEKSRLMIVRKNCNHCRLWKHFIERENLKLKPEKRITIVDATLMNDYGVYDNPLLKVFDKHIQEFPTIFIEGKKMGIANSKEEAIAFLRAYLYDDYIQPRIQLQQIECEYKKVGLFGKKILVCNNMGEEDE